jgi:hypothetical protein
MRLVPCYWQWIADAQLFRMARPLGIHVVDGLYQVIGRDIAGKQGDPEALVRLQPEVTCDPGDFGFPSACRGQTGFWGRRAEGRILTLPPQSHDDMRQRCPHRQQNGDLGTAQRRSIADQRSSGLHSGGAQVPSSGSKMPSEEEEGHSQGANDQREMSRFRNRGVVVIHQRSH